MPTEKFIALDPKETVLRQLLAFATIAGSVAIVLQYVKGGDIAQFHAALAGFGLREILIMLFYGIFAMWCTAHLDVIGDQFLGAPSGRISALKLGLVGRAFSQCGAWTRGLRWQVWRTLPKHQSLPTMANILRASRSGYVFGLCVSFLLITLIFPGAIASLTGSEDRFIRLIFGIMIGGTLFIASLDGAVSFRFRCAAIAVVLTYQLVSAFAFYVLVHGVSGISFAAILNCFVIASAVGWALRVPFMLGVLEVVLLWGASAGDSGALLAACVIFHLCFQGPAFLMALWLAYAPGFAVPVLIGQKGQNV